MSKSTWKLPFLPLLFYKKKFLEKKILNIRIRNSIIPTIFLKKNLKICIFNGIWYLSILMNLSMKGCKFGEFIFTKKIDTQTHLKKKVQKKPKGRK